MKEVLGCESKTSTWKEREKMVLIIVAFIMKTRSCYVYFPLSGKIMLGKEYVKVIWNSYVMLVAGFAPLPPPGKLTFKSKRVLGVSPLLSSYCYSDWGHS